jgi:hypothetical protein
MQKTDAKPLSNEELLHEVIRFTAFLNGSTGISTLDTSSEELDNPDVDFEESNLDSRNSHPDRRYEVQESLKHERENVSAETFCFCSSSRRNSSPTCRIPDRFPSLPAPLPCETNYQSEPAATTYAVESLFTLPWQSNHRPPAGQSR